MGEYQNEIRFINPVIDSYEDCTQLIKSYLKKNGLSLQKFGDKFNRYVSNYLTSVRSFLDHWETYIKRKFGKGSEMAKCFKQTTAEQYDTEFSYRFIYLLRNYVQHCEMPISTFKSSLVDEDNALLKILVDRDRLLNSFDWKDSVKTDLEKMPAKFDIMPYLEKMNQCLAIVHHNLIIQRFNNEILNASLNLLEFQAQYRNYKGDFAIVEYDDKFHTPKMQQIISQEGKMGLKILYFPLKLAEKLMLQFIEVNEDNIKIFNLKGNYIEKKEGLFPKVHEQKENEITNFSGGTEFAQVNGDTWVRLFSELSILNEDGIDKLFAVYARSGFSMTDLKELEQVYEKIYNILWKGN